MFHAYLMTILMYLLLVGGLRLLGKRQVGQMEPPEFVVTMLAANLATVAIEDPEASPVYGVVAILTILGGELTLSWLTLGSPAMRRLLCGKPVILIENGRLLQRNLRRTRVTLEELGAMLREKQVLDHSSVQYAILETDGSLSVFLHPLDRPATAREAGIKPRAESLPLALIEDGAFVQENLRRANRTEAWVRAVLRQRGAGVRDTMLLTVDASGTIRFVPREEGA